MELRVNDKVRYTGDMANSEGDGVIVAIRPANKWGPQTYDIAIEDGRLFKGVFINSFSGPGRRFWLLDEWEADQDRRLKESQEQMRRCIEQHTLNSLKK